MVPVSVIDERARADLAGQPGRRPPASTCRSASASPVVRLHQVSYALKAHKETGQAVAADRLAGVAGFAPTTFHALGSRVAAAPVPAALQPGDHQRARAAVPAVRRRRPDGRDLPGAAAAARARAVDRRDVVRRRRLLGLNADRDALPDVEVLGQCVTEALDELVDSISPSPAARTARPQEDHARSR